MWWLQARQQQRITKWQSPEGLAEFLTLVKGRDMATGQEFSFGEKGWEWQKDLILEFLKHRKIIILKARQLGLTWLSAIYATWKALFFPYTRILIISRNREHAADILKQYVLPIYQSLPEKLKVPLTAQRTFDFEFENGSQIKTQASTENAGRGYTAGLVIMDEVAFQQYAAETYAAVKPAVDMGGQIILISTANGVGNFFHQMWTDAEEGKNDFYPIFLPYNYHPDRDEEWYRKTALSMPSDAVMHQEYPRFPAEAFVGSGTPAFSIAILAKAKETVRDPIPTPKELAPLDPFIKVWKTPENFHVYFVGADAAEGLTRSNLNAAIVLDAETGEQVAEYVGKTNPDLYAQHLLLLAHYYQAPKIILERNGVGLAVIQTIKNLGEAHRLWRPPQPYRSHRRSQMLPEIPYGFYTNPKTKPLLIMMLAVAIGKGELKIASQDLYKELASFQQVSETQFVAAPGMTDDRVMACALAWFTVVTARRFKDQWQKLGWCYKDSYERSIKDEYEELLEWMEEERLMRSFLQPAVRILNPYEVSETPTLSPFMEGLL